ncbi:MAG: tetratricopeptide repeat protein, partial [Pseudomonadota bacterium]
SARESLEAARRLRARHSAQGSFGVAESDLQLGILAVDTGAYDEALMAIDRSLGAARALLPDPEAQELVASALNARALVASRTDDLPAAERAHRESLSIKRDLLGDMHPSLATTLNNLGAVLAKLGKHDEAEASYREALTMREAIYEDDNTRIGITINNLASLLYRRGELDEAEQMYRRTLAIRRAESYPSTAVATVLNNLARVLSEKGDASGADAAYTESIAVRRAVQGDDHVNTAITRMNLSNHLMDTRRPDSACAELSGFAPVLKDALGASHWRLASLGSLEGACLAHDAQFAAAESRLVDSLAALRTARGDASREAQRAVERVIALYDAWDRTQKKNEYETLRDQMRGAPRGTTS